MSDRLVYVIGVLGIIALLAFIYSGMAWWEYQSCQNAGDEAHRDVNWKLIGGCYIDSGSGNFVPLDNYRAVNQR